MPGQLRLTGANAAYILEGSDTITEDVVVSFDDFVTEDSDGNVDLDGDLIVTGDIKAGAGTQGGTVGAQLFPSGGVTARNSDSSAQVFGGYKSDDSSPTFSVTGNGSITAASKGTFGTGLSGSSTVIAIGPDDDRKAELNRDGTAKFQARVDFGNSNHGTHSAVAFNKSASLATIISQNHDASTNSRVFEGRNSGGQTSYIQADGHADFKSTRSANVFIKLDPNDETKVLDVKESIRNMQAALYRLKAAVLIPNASVDEMRLRILEALETITEEVD